jgi:hypothetical protein
MTTRKDRQRAVSPNAQRNHGKSLHFARDSSIEIDGLDWAILREFQQDGRIPFAALGRSVGLGASSVAERVRRIEDADLRLSRVYRLPAQQSASRSAMPFTPGLGRAAANP